MVKVGGLQNDKSPVVGIAAVVAVVAVVVAVVVALGAWPHSSNPLHIFGLPPLDEKH